MKRRELLASVAMPDLENRREEYLALSDEDRMAVALHAARAVADLTQGYVQTFGDPLPDLPPPDFSRWTEHR